MVFIKVKKGYIRLSHPKFNDNNTFKIGLESMYLKGLNLINIESDCKIEIEQRVIHIKKDEYTISNLNKLIEPIFLSYDNKKIQIESHCYFNLDENFKKYLEPLERNSERLYRLTEDILDIARIESNNLNLNKEKFDINQIIKESIDELANKIRNEKKNEFKLICLDESSEYSRDKELFVYADKNRIQQVISNMLNNAYQFTENGKIIVKIKKDYSNKQVKIRSKLSEVKI